jgi:predicted short-subunit dehydrogenase-like oxidoreductase (DUF2520 family)
MLPTRYPNMVTRYGISLIGGGRLGRSLGRSLREQGWRIHSVVTRSQTTAKRAVRSIGGGRPCSCISSQVLIPPLVLIAVPDSAIQEIADQLAAVWSRDAGKRVVLHTSGALSSEILAPLRRFGATVGSLHPLQSFSGVAAPNLEGCVSAIEGDVGAARVARSMARALGGQVLLLDSHLKPLYHAAASIAAGQILAQMEAAIQIFASLGMKRREALRALLPLTRQVLENQERLGARAAWTGPLARGDFGVIHAHEKALRSLPSEYLAAYRALNRLAARMLARDPESALSELTRISQDSIHTAKAKGASA